MFFIVLICSLMYCMSDKIASKFEGDILQDYILLMIVQKLCSLHSYKENI